MKEYSLGESIKALYDEWNSKNEGYGIDNLIASINFFLQQVD